MPDTVIRVQNLSKRYRLGELHKQTGSFREKVTESLKRLVLRGRDGKPPTYGSRSLPPSAQPESGPLNTLNSFNSLNSSTPEAPDHIWALRDVSFEVKRGEVLGIIGRNGAGKSTLLKILSRITKPTEGKAWLNGRVGSLLEVGTGFHQELTGRENIYLNGAILGMTKAEIKRKFDEIVEFAEIEKFIDTPVKRYSSGMYVRLAFAVAAHLEPDIILVDEVLAVGDAMFQQKCIGKMHDVSKDGRTVLFVSHSMTTISRLCSRCVLLGSGMLKSEGLTSEVISRYLRPLSAANRVWRLKGDSMDSKNDCWLNEAWLESDTNEPVSEFKMGDLITVKARFVSSRPLRNPALGVRIWTHDGTVIGVVNNWMTNHRPLISRASTGLFSCTLKALRLNPGRYSITLVLSEPSIDHFTAQHALTFEVLPFDIYGTGRIPGRTQGFTYFDAKWSFEEA